MSRFHLPQSCRTMREAIFGVGNGEAAVVLPVRVHHSGNHIRHFRYLVATELPPLHVKPKGPPVREGHNHAAP